MKIELFFSVVSFPSLHRSTTIDADVMKINVDSTLN